LSRADLRDAKLGPLMLDDNILLCARLDGVSARYADFRGADLRGASIRSADFGYVNLIGANLRDADTAETQLGGAKLHAPRSERATG
jgi:uncharacterized protein YjbI with pentapeptide repeats